MCPDVCARCWARPRAHLPGLAAQQRVVYDVLCAVRAAVRERQVGLPDVVEDDDVADAGAAEGGERAARQWDRMS